MGRLGAGLYGISLYGGLLLFSGFLLYDTQIVINRAEQHPPPIAHLFKSPADVPANIVPTFDPINK